MIQVFEVKWDTDLYKVGESIKGPLLFILWVIFDDSFLVREF